MSKAQPVGGIQLFDGEYHQFLQLLVTDMISVALLRHRLDQLEDDTK